MKEWNTDRLSDSGIAENRASCSKMRSMSLQILIHPDHIVIDDDAKHTCSESLH